jgi:hypothetical protein
LKERVAGPETGKRGGGRFGLKSFESEKLVFMGMEKMVVQGR